MFKNFICLCLLILTNVAPINGQTELELWEQLVADKNPEALRLYEAMFNNKTLLDPATLEAAGSKVQNAAKFFDLANKNQSAADLFDFYQKASKKDKAVAIQEIMPLEYRDRNRHPKSAKMYSSIGQLFSEKGDHKTALKFQQQSLIAISAEFENQDINDSPKKEDLIAPEIAIPILVQKGNVLNSIYSENKDKVSLLAALKSYENAIDILSFMRKKYEAASVKEELTGRIVNLCDKAIQTCMKLYEITGSDIYREKAFSIAEKGKAMILMEAIMQSKSREVNAIPDSIIGKEQYLKIEIGHYNKLLKYESKSASPEQIKTWNDRVFKLHEDLYSIQDVLDKKFSGHDELKYKIEPSDLSTIQADLKRKNALMVNYFSGDENLYLFVASAEYFDVSMMPHDPKIEVEILQLRAELNNLNWDKNPEQSLNNFKDKSYAVYQKILEPAIASQIGTFEHLIVVPDDIYWLIPFEVLLSAVPSDSENSFSNLPYLIRDYAVSYAHSGTVFTQHPYDAANMAAMKSFAGFAPSFPSQIPAESRNCIQEGLGYLHYNQPEVKEIAGSINGEAFLAKNATKEAFLEAAKETKILHLATHACVDDDKPLENRIYFYNGTYMTPEEIYNSQIKSGMIVLSACETGMGEIQKGEGMRSLARSFAYSGCPNITMSLWPVADESTAQIMVDYYKNLKKGQPNSKALQGAKLAFLEGKDKSKFHPSYWAAFVHLGNDVDLQLAKTSIPWQWIASVCAICLFVFLFLKKKRD